MRKITLIVAIFMILAGCAKVPAGHKGIKVYLLGGDKGVDAEEVGVGRYWLGFNEELFIFPTFTQNYVWTKDPAEGSPTDESISFQTKEGLVASADVGISYSINPNKVSEIFQKYRRGIDEITDVYLRNMVRDAIVTSSSAMSIESVYGAGKVDLMNAAFMVIKNQVEPIGINIEKLYWIGDIRLPPPVMASITAKIEATQKAKQRENEVALAKAEADKQIAAAEGEAQSILKIATAQAESNRLLSQSITPNLIDYERVKKWNGTVPQVSGNAVPFIGLDKP